MPLIADKALIRPCPKHTQSNPTKIHMPTPMSDHCSLRRLVFAELCLNQLDREVFDRVTHGMIFPQTVVKWWFWWSIPVFVMCQVIKPLLVPL